MFLVKIVCTTLDNCIFQNDLIDILFNLLFVGTGKISSKLPGKQQSTKRKYVSCEFLEFWFVHKTSQIDMSPSFASLLQPVQNQL